MIRVRIKLMGGLKERTPESGRIELPDGATIQSVLARLDVAADRVHVVTVNGQLETDRRRMLDDGDALAILPPVGGG